MQSIIKNISPKKLIGKRITTNLADNKTFELWKNFMPRRKEIKNTIGANLFSVQNYDTNYFKEFDPTANFERWAAIEVLNTNEIPNEMEVFDLSGGLYAVFFYKGLNTDFTVFDYIFRTWLPNSEFDLDHRPHFEIMGAKYKNNHPDSEEEIWIPIRRKK